ncbi:hypothetical protein [Nonomuraea solani]|uniref:hypothetical protein n=1 Tax=Nonomuraea solani TaxID=1144553 RepID=UPI000CDEB860|nr:hypothetical protein [Nonomuraea solani]
MILLTGTAALLVLVMLYPYLPGEYDPLAVPLSTMAQLVGLIGLLLVPVGIVWLISGRAGIASVIVMTLVVLVATLFAWLTSGLLLGALTLAAWAVALSRWVPRLKERRFAPVVPLCLVVLPPIALLVQLLMRAPMTEFSRNSVIANSGEIVGDIERHRAQYGRYPDSLTAVNKDYQPYAAGIEQYHYVQRGNSYSVFFAQPRFLLDDFGAREYVMYDPRDEHMMPSHAVWVLLWSQDRIRAQQGWYAMGDAGSPHWKYFLFD